MPSKVLDWIDFPLKTPTLSNFIPKFTGHVITCPCLDQCYKSRAPRTKNISNSNFAKSCVLVNEQKAHHFEMFDYCYENEGAFSGPTQDFDVITVVMLSLAYKPKTKFCVIKIWIGLKLGSSLCCALLIAALFAIFCYTKPCIKRTWHHVLTNPCRFCSRPCDNMDTNYPLPLSEKQLRELEASAKDHAMANGKMTKY